LGSLSSSSFRNDIDSHKPLAGGPGMSQTDQVGCPVLGLGGWVLGFSLSASSFRDDIDTDKPWLPHYVEWPTAPCQSFGRFTNPRVKGVASGPPAIMQDFSLANNSELLRFAIKQRVIEQR